jgi:hypothetical protein
MGISPPKWLIAASNSDVQTLGNKTQTHIHSLNTFTHLHVCTPTQVIARTHSCAYTFARTCIHKHRQTCAYTNTGKQMHACIFARARRYKTPHTFYFAHNLTFSFVHTLAQILQHSRTHIHRHSRRAFTYTILNADSIHSH